MSLINYYPKKIDSSNTVTIATSGTASTTFNCESGTLIGLIVPSTFSGTKLTVYSSTSLGYILYKNATGTTVEITGIDNTIDAHYALSTADILGVQDIKLVSDVTQSGSDCIVTLVFRPL